MMKQVIRIALLVPALAAGLLIGASQATAAVVDQSTPTVNAAPEKCGAFLGDGIRVRQAPRLNAPVNGYGYRGDCVLYNESTRGDQANCDGRSTNVWTRVEVLDSRSPVGSPTAGCATENHTVHSHMTMDGVSPVRS